MEKITLEQFMEEAPMVLEAFMHRTRELTDSGEEAFPVGRRADASWWWREVAAYVKYVEVQEHYRRYIENQT